MLVKHKNLFPLLLLVALCVYTAVSIAGAGYADGGETGQGIYTSAHFLGLCGVLLCLLTYFFYRPAFKHGVASLLLLGLSNLANFIPPESTFGGQMKVGNGRHGARIGFQPVSFLFVLAYYFLNFSRINSFFLNPLKPTAEEIERRRKEEVSV